MKKQWIEFCIYSFISKRLQILDFNSFTYLLFYSWKISIWLIYIELAQYFEVGQKFGDI